jgi:hypothetical protein
VPPDAQITGVGEAVVVAILCDLLGDAVRETPRSRPSPVSRLLHL